MKALLEKRNTIYGICAIWIVLFHTFRRIGMPFIPVVTNIIAIGNMAVDVFFFFSGLCLSLSAKKNDYLNTGWNTYFKRRFTRVIVPYLIICVPYYLWAAVYESSGGFAHRALRFIANISSASFWLKGTQTTWYLYGIVLFYMLFPLLYSFAVKNDRKKITGLLAGMIIFAVITAYVPILKNSMIVWARLPIFMIGLLAGVHYESIKPAKIKRSVAAVSVFLILGWIISVSEISESFTIPQVGRFLLYIPMTLSLMYIFSIFGSRLSVFEWIGSISLEVYLVHITLLHPIKYYGIMNAVGYWLYLILPIISVFIAAIVGRIEKR